MKVPHYSEIKVRRWELLPKVTVGFLFDLYAWHLLWQDKKIQLQDIGSQKPDTLISMMLYNAARSFSKDKGQKIWYTQGQIENWLDELTHKEFADLQQVFVDSFAEMKKDSNVEEAGIKKK